MSADGVTVRLASAADREVWNGFAEGRPGADACHLFEWRAALAEAYRTPTPYLVARAGGECVGILPLVLLRDLRLRRALFSLPFLDGGGIVARQGAAAGALWREALALAGELGARGIELRGGLPDADADARTRRYRLLLELPGSAEELWRRLGPKVRNQVRKAEKSGLATAVAGSEGLGAFYDVFAETMLRLGSPVHGRRFFASILEHLGARARLWLTAERGGRVVASALAISFAGSVVVPWAASRLAARPQCPNHSLYWAILSDAVAGGARSFDFGRSWEGSGTFRFKRQWGAEAVPLAWASYDPSGRRRESRSLEPARHPRLVGLWRRLPAALANRIGPVLRARIPN